MTGCLQNDIETRLKLSMFFGTVYL